MSLSFFFKSQTAEVPRAWKGTDFYAQVKDDLDNFRLELAKEIEKENCVISKHLISIGINTLCADLCSRILQTLAYYLDGHPAKAFDELKNLLAAYQEHLQRLYSVPLQAGAPPLFRIRGNSGAIDKGGIFHLPISCRHKVQTQRYSIPGFPCLYLATSLQTAAIECNRADTASLLNSYAARFRTRNGIRVLNLGYSNSELSDLLDLGKYSQGQDQINLWSSLIVMFPVVIVSSYVVQYRDSPFKPEYVLPQLLLQYVRDSYKQNSIDGVRYFSTRSVKNPGANPSNGFTKRLNFVFPISDSVISQPNNGYCTRLRSMFEFTDPIDLSKISNQNSLQDFRKIADECEKIIMDEGIYPLGFF